MPLIRKSFRNISLAFGIMENISERIISMSGPRRVENVSTLPSTDEKDGQTKRVNYR